MLNYNQIYSLDVFDFLNVLPDNSVDLAIIDPPYNLKVADWDTFINQEEFLNFSYRWIDCVLPKLKTTSSLYIFNTPYNCALFLNYLQNKANFRNWITWYKKDGFSNSKKKYNTVSETILFFTISNSYTFNVDNIRIPYESTARIEHAKTKGILKNGKEMDSKVYVLPHELDVEIAKLKLNSMGYDLDSLTQEQIDYLTKVN